MKVTFIYTDYNPFGHNVKKFNYGVAILSSYLKAKGHQTSLIHISQKIDKEEFTAYVQDHNPDLIAFSFITKMWPQVKKFTSWVKELDIPRIHGGVQPTINPEEVIDFDGVDVLCRGEGEEALLQFCNHMEAGLDIQGIKNLWVKKRNGQVVKNPIRPLIENLDELPQPDYDLFHYSQLQDAKPMKRLVVMASRGCPYQCTYCCNHFVRSLYPNKGKYVRFKSVPKLIDEIKKGLQKYPFLETVRFFDDTLSLNKEWFDEFVEEYSKEINVQYSCNDRPNHINLHIAAGLKKSGCNLVELGIESGNDHIRNHIMRRFLSNKQIIDAFRILRSFNIKTTAFNILGVPFETMPTMLETVKLNAKAAPDQFINAYFYPFSKTDLFEICKAKGLLTDRVMYSFFEGPVLRLDTVSEDEIIFVYKYFDCLVKLYKRYMSFPSYLSTKFITKTDKLLCFKYFPYRFFNKKSFKINSIFLLIVYYMKMWTGAFNIFRCFLNRKNVVFY